MNTRINKEYDIELLKTLYWIHSPSGFECGIQGFIRSCLTEMGIRFEVDDLDQTYYLSNKNMPLLVSHTDQVSNSPISRLKETEFIIKGDDNLGADDKNGIWIILSLLKENPNLNFCFSNKEEMGGDIDYLLADNEDILGEISYALVFDRRGSSDIIGNMNGYCSIKFEEEICEVGKSFGYSIGMGTFSDCDEISKYLNCVNLSCGYYRAHSVNEYTNKKHLINALEFGKEIIKIVKGPFKHSIIQSSWFNNWSYGDLRNDSYSACPHCHSKMDALEVYDTHLDEDILYGERCPKCFFESFLDDPYYDRY